MLKVKCVRSFSLFIILSACLAQASKFEMQDISAREFVDLMRQPDVVVIDVRTPHEYRKGRIPDAINLPHQKILAGDVDLTPYKNKHLIFYCHTGLRVGKVEKYLSEAKVDLGETKLKHLNGDFRAWQATGNKIIRQ